jgi:2-polyprenyl-3-methyl-5-hydroxy-6-metoxy-1,4-benzoquinol methylase
MQSQELVESYFNREAKRFDAIYEARKPWHQRLGDRLLRQVVVNRFHLICNLAPLPGSWSVLDVGCGPGRYALAMARAGAATIVGVDVSSSMIDLARTEAENSGVGGRCNFLNSSFLSYETSERFDVVVATGYFDYTEKPVLELKKMASLCQGKIFASFPKRWECRVPTRKLRFALVRGFVRFYSRRELEQILSMAGMDSDRTAIVDLGRDWIVIARPEEMR